LLAFALSLFLVRLADGSMGVFHAVPGDDPEAASIS